MNHPMDAQCTAKPILSSLVEEVENLDASLQQLGKRLIPLRRCVDSVPRDDTCDTKNPEEPSPFRRELIEFTDRLQRLRYEVETIMGSLDF